jgi:hypothetical protein
VRRNPPAPFLLTFCKRKSGPEEFPENQQILIAIENDPTFQIVWEGLPD